MRMVGYPGRHGTGFTSIDNFWKETHAPISYVIIPMSRGGGMADTRALRALVRKGVRVRLSPAALRFAQCKHNACLSQAHVYAEEYQRRSGG